MGFYGDLMGFYRDLMGFYRDLMGFYGDLMGFYRDSMGYSRSNLQSDLVHCYHSEIRLIGTLGETNKDVEHPCFPRKIVYNRLVFHIFVSLL